MASITIRNLDDDIKRRLRVRAAEHGRSMEEEARDILRQVVGQPGAPRQTDVDAAPRNLGLSIHAKFAALGGVDLPLTKRTAMRPAPDLE